MTVAMLHALFWLPLYRTEIKIIYSYSVKFNCISDPEKNIYPNGIFRASLKERNTESEVIKTENKTKPAVEETKAKSSSENHPKARNNTKIQFKNILEDTLSIFYLY